MSNDNFKNDHLDDLFKNILKEEKKEKINWEFDDFLAQVEPISKSKKIVWFASKKVIALAIAATLMLSLGIWYIFQSNEPISQNLAEYKDLNEKKKEDNNDQTIHPTEEPVVLVVENKEVQHVVNEAKHNIKKTKEEPTYNPEYVIVNGEPVYDLELAKQMTLESLGKFAENVEKSVSNMAHIKYLSIKF